MAMTLVIKDTIPVGNMRLEIIEATFTGVTTGDLTYNRTGTSATDFGASYVACAFFQNETASRGDMYHARASSKLVVNNVTAGDVCTITALCI